MHIADAWSAASPACRRSPPSMMEKKMEELDIPPDPRVRRDDRRHRRRHVRVQGLGRPVRPRRRTTSSTRSRTSSPSASSTRSPPAARSSSPEHLFSDPLPSYGVHLFAVGTRLLARHGQDGPREPSRVPTCHRRLRGGSLAELLPEHEISTAGLVHTSMTSAARNDALTTARAARRGRAALARPPLSRRPEAREMSRSSRRANATWCSATSRSPDAAP